jgi:cold shock CspA family protein/ribosome-associated translation inhibitor RaiA
MQTPVEIDFRGMNPVEHVRSAVSTHIDELEQRFGRVTSCRVVVKSPGVRHRTGGLYEVNIHLALPNGRAVNVGRTATADERHSDIAFAINDAFKRARRRLQDHVRQMQGHVKSHEGKPIGTVKRIEEAGGYGFLETADGREIYFHRNSVLNGAFSRLAAGARVAFSEEMGDKGPQASTIDLLGKHGWR